MIDLSDDELLAELGVSVEKNAVRVYTPQQERIIAGFEDILKFHDEHGRAPQHGEQRDIFERLYRRWLRRAAKACDACAAQQLRRFETWLPHGAARKIRAGRPRRPHD